MRPATSAAMPVVTGTAAMMPSPPTRPRTTSWATTSWLTAITEGQRLLTDARQEASLEQARARDSLRKDVGTLAVAGASRLLQREIDPKAHADLIDQLAREIEGARA